MRVAILGGTGFVGSYIVDALVNAGMEPVLLVRPGRESGIRHQVKCALVSGDTNDDEALAETITDADAVIYNIGILREQPKQNITFSSLHDLAARRAMDVAQRQGAKRFLLMSANGVCGDGTPYQRTKHSAEQYLANSELQWTIMRPSVVFGDPRGRMEFATQLLHEVVRSPLPAPLFFPGTMVNKAGRFRLSPVHVENVAQAFALSLSDGEQVGKTIHLGGPQALEWRTIISTIAAAVGVEKPMLPVPAAGVTAIAALLDHFESFPVTGDQIRMLMEGNVCGDSELRHFGIEPTPFSSTSLGYLAGDLRKTGKWQQSVA